MTAGKRDSGRSLEFSDSKVFPPNHLKLMVIDSFLREITIKYMRLMKGDTEFGNRREGDDGKERFCVGH